MSHREGDSDSHTFERAAQGDVCHNRSDEEHEHEDRFGQRRAGQEEQRSQAELLDIEADD